MRNTKVSFYKTCKSRTQEEVPFFSVIKDIHYGRYQNEIEELRALPSKEDRTRFKSSKLPAFTYSVTCNGSHKSDNITTYTGMIGLDYDNVTNPSELRDAAANINTTTAAFISPSGNGVKVFVNTNATKENHKLAFNEVSSFYDDYLNETSDASVKNLTRLCFVSYDPETFVNESSIAFDIEKAMEINDSTTSIDLDYLFRKSMLGFSEGNRHSTLVSCAGTSNRYGISKDDVINYFKPYTDDSFTMDEVEETVNDVYNRYHHQFNTRTQGLDIRPLNQWLDYDFNRKTANATILKHLSQDIAIHESSGTIFKMVDGAIDYGCKLSQGDFILRLQDCGFYKSEATIKRILKSDWIRKVTSLNLLLERIMGNPWDGIDRITTLVEGANLKGDLYENIDLFNRWLCTAYSYAFRGIDQEIHFNDFSRVVLILYSQMRGVGKSTFFRNLGMTGEIEKRTGIGDLDFYSEFAGELTKDSRELYILMESKMIIQIDDIDSALMNDSGNLRSVISKNSSDSRVLHSETVKQRTWRGVLCGSTNHEYLLRDNDENRYLIFESNGTMDFDKLNAIDYIQLWSQVRYLCMKDKKMPLFDTQRLELVKQKAQKFLYKSPTLERIEEFIEFSPVGKMRLNDIIKYLQECNVHNISDNVLGKELKKLAPSGEKIKKIINGTNYYRVHKKNYNSVDDSENLDLLF